ncbi:protease modulator HflC [Thiohalobacter thiocyanaticus]|uniref:Protein HflC n=1 Tax=Thiohalobacter thiocyanaticus TaxID=585455 RepID=A0A426QN01_9GAMM|nr:protease modulator HflC [Thiohalobacter thiocyanaticus]RRQ23138.1 protease modulator HflC [Thiohalobacter thiocyanaticus]
MRFPLLIVLVIVLVLGYLSLFTVDEREKAIMFRLGEIVRSDFEPGLHLKMPIINNVRKFDSRVLTLDSRPEQILTGEKKNVLVDYYVKWRIEQVEEYYRSFGGRESDALSRMAQTIKDGLQAELGNRTIREVVSDERTQIMRNVATKADEKMAPFGIDIIDVRIKQIELPANVATSVFDRMRAERERIAKEHRAEGEKAARIIRARADRERTELLADARRQAEELRGTGDAQATRIYAEAFSQDESFFDFYRSMQAYRESFASKQDILLLQPDSEFFQYFSGSAQGR